MLSLDLDVWINEPEPDTDALIVSEGSLEIFYKTSMQNPEIRDTYGYQADATPSPDASNELLKQRRESRRMEQESNPHYLKSSSRVRHSPILSPSDENSLGIKESTVLNAPQAPKSTTTARKLSDKYFELEMNKEKTVNAPKKHRSKKEKKKKNSKEKRNGTNEQVWIFISDS